MKKRFKKIIKLFIALLISIVTIIAITFYFYPSLFVDFYVSYDKNSIWVTTSPLAFSWKILDTSSENDDLSWSPDEKYLAYTDFVREVIYDKEYFIKIIDPRTLKTRTVFIGDYHTSHYRWLDNENIRVYVGGASSAIAYTDINIHTKEPFVTVDHNKEEDSYLWGMRAWYEYDDSIDEWPGY